MRVRLKIAIVTAGKSQREVAAACCIPENRMSEIVRGWTDPREQERARLRSVLGVGDDVFDVRKPAAQETVLSA